MHVDGSGSKTALMVAAYRGRASARSPAICNDPWAAALAGTEGGALAARFDVRFPHMELWIGLRTAYIDSYVRQWTRAEGLRQVVLLGAGLDTRAARLAHGGVRFYEVDHPATQADKRERLAALAGYPAGAACYVPCDLEGGDDFLARLYAAGFDAQQPAFVVWEGVAPYLSEAAVRSTVRRVAEGMHPRSALIFDFLGKRMAERQNIKEKDQQMLEYVRELGEPIRWGSNDVLPLLYAEGFRYVRVTSFDEIALHLTGTYAREREFRFQHLALASCTAPPLP